MFLCVLILGAGGFFAAINTLPATPTPVAPAPVAPKPAAPAPAPAPAVVPTPAPIPTGHITLSLSGGSLLAISDSLPFVAVSELKRSFQIIPKGETYQFTEVTPFYLRNITANPVQLSSPYIPPEEAMAIPHRYPLIFPTVRVGNEWLFREEKLAPNESIEVSLLSLGSLEELRQFCSRLRYEGMPEAEELERIWREGRSFWEYVLSQGQISFRYVPAVAPPPAPAPAPYPTTVPPK